MASGGDLLADEVDELTARGHLTSDQVDESHMLDPGHHLDDQVLHHQDKNGRVDEVEIEGLAAHFEERGNPMEKGYLTDGGHPSEEVQFDHLEHEDSGLDEDEVEAGGRQLAEVEAEGHLNEDEMEAGDHHQVQDEGEAGDHHLDEDEEETEDQCDVVEVGGGHLNEDEVDVGGPLDEDEQEDDSAQAVFLTSHLALQMEIGEVRKFEFFLFFCKC